MQKQTKYNEKCFFFVKQGCETFLVGGKNLRKIFNNPQTLSNKKNYDKI